jgi:hypothetical protein
MDLLIVTSPDPSLQFLFCAKIPIYMFPDENWFKRCIAKDDSGSEKTVNYSDDDLDCINVSVCLLDPKRHIASGKQYARILLALGTSKAPIGWVLS